LDLMVLRSLRDWRLAGRRAMLVTVTRTWGSSPRPVGSIMALAQGGAVVGSVSGGCIEDDMIAQHAQAIPSGPPQQVRYGVSADEAHRFGLPCGGTLELLLEFDPDASLLDTLVSTLERGELLERRVSLQEGHVELRAVSAPQPLRLTQEHLYNTFGPEYRMLIIGAGQLSEYLATMALFCGFAVTVCDPREEYSGAWGVAGVTLTREMPDDVVQSFRPDARSCVVALTHDPKLDDLALLEALQSEAFSGCDRFKTQQPCAPRAHDRALRAHKRHAGQPARTDWHLYWQQDAFRNCGERDGRNSGCEKSGAVAA